MQPHAAGGDRPRVENPLQQGSDALSLKARETASLSLKRIFEQHVQINSNEAAHAEAHALITHHLQKGDGQQRSTQLHVDLDLRLAAPSTSVSNQTDMVQHQPLQVQSLRPMSGNATAADITPTNKGTADQLTIFYAGTVCVFENIPANKAKAVMLLMAGGSPGDQSYTTSGEINGSRGNAVCKSRPTTPEIILSARPLKPRSRSQAELPFARKASLARFLEKRKDRVEAQANTIKEETTNTKDGEISTEPSQKRLCTKF